MKKKSSIIKEFQKTDVAQKINNAFPDAKILDIQEENND